MSGGIRRVIACVVWGAACALALPEPRSMILSVGGIVLVNLWDWD